MKINYTGRALDGHVPPANGWNVTVRRGGQYGSVYPVGSLYMVRTNAGARRWIGRLFTDTILDEPFRGPTRGVVAQQMAVAWSRQFDNPDQSPVTSSR